MFATITSQSSRPPIFGVIQSVPRCTPKKQTIQLALLCQCKAHARLLAVSVCIYFKHGILACNVTPNLYL